MRERLMKKPSISALFILLVIAELLLAQPTGKYALAQFDNSGCMAKGRVQDCGGEVMHQILTDGENAIPILISQLTETTRAKHEIADYWDDTRTGDVAFVVLTDLFTEPDGRTAEMPGVPNWKVVMNGCDSVAQSCWDKYLQEHGRLSVQQAWSHAWKLHKHAVRWDSKARCFRVSGP